MVIARDFQTRVQLQFLKNVVNVALDRVDCKGEPAGNLLVAKTFSD